MSTTSQHIIQRQYLHVEINGMESDGLALQRSLPNLCHNWLIPAIERVFERWAPLNGNLYIERLEIDAGIIQLERLEHDLPELVEQALEKLLVEQTRPDTASTAIISANTKHKTLQQTVAEAFIYFLQTGSLPWSFQLLEGGSLEQTVLDSWQLTTEFSASSGSLRNSILAALTSATARQRLVRQFSPAFLETLCAMLSPEGKKAIDEVLRVLRSSSASSSTAKFFEKRLWETAFSHIATGHTLSAINIVGEAWSVRPDTTAEDASLTSVLEHHWPDAIVQTPVISAGAANRIDSSAPITPKSADTTPLDDTKPRISGKVRPIPPAPSVSKKTVKIESPELATPKSAGKTSPDDIEPATLGSVKPIPPRQPVSEKTVTDTGEHPGAEEGIYIKNSGLVILHPFLPQLFAALEIAGEDELLQPERALCLLHYLATGQSGAPEYELVLPKVLCNVPLISPVEYDLDLTGSEKEEADALLEAVIRHWSVLRNTSPDGLRGTFLLRPGKVSLRDGSDWLLQVESNAYDDLLDELPWGISNIKLPWMDRMLWVEWR